MTYIYIHMGKYGNTIVIIIYGNSYSIWYINNSNYSKYSNYIYIVFMLFFQQHSHHVWGHLASQEMGQIFWRLLHDQSLESFNLVHTTYGH